MPNTTDQNGGICLTIPPNRLWRGVITLAATLTASAGTNVQQQYPSIVVSGQGAEWSDGDTVLRLALATPPVSLSSLTGLSVGGFASTGEIVVQTHGDQLQLALSIGPGVVAAATAIGGLL